MSRLLNSDDNERIRNFLESRNLYTPNDPYNVDTREVVNTINTILNTINPFSSIDVRNTAVGRALGVATGEDTPLAQIGAVMLARQLANTAKSGAFSTYVPTTTLDFFNKNVDLFTRKIDYDITDRGDQTAFGKFFENITRSYRAINPFAKGATNLEYLSQTGKGQIQNLVYNLNQNWYAKSDERYLAVLNDKGFDIDSYTTLIKSRFIFLENPSDQLFDPYSYFSNAFSANVEYKANDVASRSDSNDRSYAENINDAIEARGKTTFLDKEYNLSLPRNRYGLPNDNDNQIVWGRDGVRSLSGGISPAFNNNAALRGESENEEALFPDTLGNFGARRGLLLYTSELLNATEGKFVDQTRKIFKNSKDGSIVGKQGSGLFIPPNTNYAQAMGFVNGVRQHTAIDQYNRFAKTIRFEGNKVYGGHENSVIFDSVMPNIAPYVKNEDDEFSPENIQNRNLMFSIENLAFELDKDCTIKADLYEGTTIQLPKCQRGPNNGRLMWFAPYEIDVTEQAAARYTDTQFIGRGEPIYTYSNSERFLTLSYKLLVDHPPQAKNRNDDRSVRNFFQFGGYEEEESGIEEFKNLPELRKREISLISQINEIENKVQINPVPTVPDILHFYYPNNEPAVGENTRSAIDEILFDNYENDTIGSTIWTKNYGRNNDFEVELQALIDNFLNPEIGSRYLVKVVSSTSDLAPNAFNQALSQRRAESLIDYIDFKIQQTHSVTSAADIGISFEAIPTGEVGDVRTETKEQIFDLPAVLARKASILVTLKNENQTEKSNQLSKEEERTAEEKKIELKETQRQIKTALGYDKRKSTTCGFNRYKVTDRNQVGYESFVKDDAQRNRFQPVFYSQDPKDFHDRLTFLHQCTRQGPPVRKKLETTGGEISVSAKNSVFGRQPICILRLGDQWYTKVIIENIQISYSNSPWDTNPEGYGMQFMSADVTMQMKVIGGQSLTGPISVLQNAVTFNYYANSTYGKDISPESSAAYYFEKLQYGGDESEPEGNGVNENAEKTVLTGPNSESVNRENLQKQ